MHRDWDSLAAFYLDLAKQGAEGGGVFTALGRLCTSISSSALRDGLFGHTSMFNLKISQVETDFPPHHTLQWLVLRPDNKNGCIEITLESGRPHNEGDWVRKVGIDEVEACFNTVLRELGWSYYPV